MAAYTVSFDKITGSIIIPVVLEHNGCVSKLLALIDTGVTMCSIPKWVSTQLNLPKESEVSHTLYAKGGDICPIVTANLFLSKHVVFKNIKFVELNSESSSYDIIIGMDVLNCGTVAISNFNGHTTFTFQIPSIEEIAFSPPLNLKSEIESIINSLLEY